MSYIKIEFSCFDNEQLDDFCSNINEALNKFNEIDNNILMNEVIDIMFNFSLFNKGFIFSKETNDNFKIRINDQETLDKFLITVKPWVIKMALL